MAETTGGLSAAEKQPEEGNVSTKGFTRVGKYMFPTASGETKLDNSILQQMEELYQKKLREGRGLLSGLKDAAALSMAARPGGSSAYLQQREQQKADRAAELFNIRAQMAQYQAQQEANKRFEEEKPQLLGGGAGSGIKFSPEEAAMLRRIKDPATFNKLLNQIVMERSKGLSQPSAQEAKYEVQYYDDNGNVVYNVVDLPTKQRLERSGRLVDVSAPRTAPKAATPAPAAQPPAAQPPAAQPPAAQPPAAQPPAAQPPAAKKVSGQYLFEDISPEMLTNMEKFIQSRDPNFNVSRLSSPSAKESFNAMPLDKRKRLFEGISDEQPAMKLASAELPAPLEKPEAPEMPAGEPTQVAQVGRIPTIPELRAQQEMQKFAEQERIKTLQEEEKAFNTSTNLQKAERRYQVSTEIIDTVTKNPELVGYLQKPGVAAALGKMIRDGISVGGYSVGAKQIEEALFGAVPGRTKADMEARDRLRSLFEETAFQLSGMLKGQGQVTEFERILLQQVAGSTSNAPGNIIKIHKGLQELALVDKKLGEAYRQSGLPYSQFIRSKEYKGIMDGYSKRLEEIRKENVAFPGGRSVEPGATPQPFKDPAKEKEYQEWKRRQLQKGNK